MADYLLVIENIHSFLAGTDQTSTDDLVELAASYAALRKDANERLRRCVDHLHRGLRTEAIHFAESQPRLLDFVAALDIPEIAEWEALCAVYDLTKPVRLSIEAAQELNEAYALDQPLQTLLRQHRLLGLARAPLRERISVLRELASQDGQNSVWADDIPVLETVRCRHMRSELVSAAKAGDGNVVDQLLAELENGNWSIEMPPDLAEAARRSSHSIHHARVIQQLQALLPQLNTAYSAMSYAECKSFLLSWDAIADSSSLEISREMQEQVQPIAEWVAEQDQRAVRQRSFCLACAALEQALSEDQTTPTLQRLYRDATTYAIPLEPDLERKYAQKIESQFLQLRRRRSRNWAIAVASILFAAIGIGALIYRGIVERKVEQWDNEISAMLREGSVAEAQRRWETMNAQAVDLAKRPQLVQLKIRLDEAVQKEAERAAAFRQRMDAAIKTGAEKTAEQDLEEIKKLARTPAERIELLNFSITVEQLAQERQKATDASFQAKLDELVSSLGQLDSKLLESDPAAFAQKLDDARATTNQLTAMQAVSPETRSSLGPITKRLETLRQDHEKLKTAHARQDRERESIAKLKDAARSSSQLAMALQTFVRDFPGSSCASDFGAAAKGALAGQAVEDWESLLVKWNRRLVPANTKDMADRLAEIQSYMERYPRSPLGLMASRYQEYLIQAQLAIDPEGPWKNELRRIMNSPLINQVNCLTTPDGQRYYYKSGGDNYTENRIGNRVVAQIKAIQSNDVNKTRSKLVPAGAKSGLSGQTMVAQEALEQIDKLNYQAWETFGFDVADKVRSRRDIDSILKVILLERIYSLCQIGSLGAKDSLQEIVKNLKSCDVGEVAWMNPDDKNLDAAHRSADRALGQLPPADGPRVTASKIRSELTDDLFAKKLDGIAVLIRNGETWTVQTVVPLTNGQQMLAVLASANGDVVLKGIGQVADGHATFDPEALRGIPEGSPVFLYQILQTASK